jgi:L-ascorbate metabolism protein UlaG (beta-lactamase superfamily)
MRRLLVASLILAVTAGAAPAQEKKAVQVRWFGHSFFMVVTTQGTRVAFDPHAISEYGNPMISPDILLISHPHNDHNRREMLANAESKDLKVFQGAIAKGKIGEWVKIGEKVKDCRIRSVGTYHDEEEGAKRGKNSAMILEADGLVFCHLGDLGTELSPEQVKEIGPVDVLMIPVGGIYTINGETAKKVVAQLKPRLYVLPMHYATRVYGDLQGPEEFLEGEKKVTRQEDSNLLTIPVDMKADKPTIVLLGWK